MDVLVPSNYPMPSQSTKDVITEEDWDSLWLYTFDPSRVNQGELDKEARERSRDMYRRLKDSHLRLHGLSNDQIEELVKEDSKIPSKLMEYCYKSYGFSDRPYDRLLVNRDQNGELILPHFYDEDFDDVRSRYCGCLEKDQQYNMLAQAIKKRLNLQLDYMIEHHSFARTFAEENKLKLLRDFDVHMCVDDIVLQSHYRQIFDDTRSLCYYLKDKEMQRISPADREMFSVEAQEKFPLANFNFAVKMVFPNGKKRYAKHVTEIVEEFYRSNMKSLRRFPTPVAEYIELKLKIAEELGIIKRNKKGFFVDAFSVAPEN